MERAVLYFGNSGLRAATGGCSAAAHSKGRLPPLEAWAARGLSAEDMFMALNRSTSPAFHHGYQRGAGTLHTIVGEPAKRRILIGIGGDAAALEEDMLNVSLDEWLRGQNLPVARLEGQLGGMAHPFEWPVPRAPRKATRDLSTRART